MAARADGVLVFHFRPIHSSSYYLFFAATESITNLIIARPNQASRQHACPKMAAARNFTFD
jgi:hypothetical protein